MRFFNEFELRQMTTDQLYLYISELHNEIESTRTTKKSRAGVFTLGSPNIVKDFVKKEKDKLDKERGETRG